MNLGFAEFLITFLALPKSAPERLAGLVLVAPALPTNEKGGGLMGKAGLGGLLRQLYVRSLMQTDGPGLNYVRRRLR